MDRKPNTLRTDLMCGNKRLHIHISDNHPSWRRYGKGVANVEATFYPRAKRVGLQVEETAFACKASNEKRDVTRGGMVEIDLAAAIALRDNLNEFIAAAEAE